MSTGKHQPKSVLDKIDANTLKLIIIAAAVIVVAAVIITTVVLVTNNGNGDPTPPGPGGAVTDGSDGTGEDDPSSESSDGPGKDDPTGATDPEPTGPDPTEVTEPPAPQYTNPLTGLETSLDISGRRPYAVMFNNIRIATPQSGISSADILFEVPVEGGITRFMGVFQDFKGSLTLGSIRSARPYFVDLAMSFDAIYIHAGGSDDAYQSLKDTGITHIDGTNGTGETFFQDQDRMHNMGYEHSLMLDVTRLDGYMEKYSLRTTHNAGFSAGLNFSEDVQRSGVACTEVDAVFNGSKSTSFSYDATTKLYNISQYGGPMMDSLTGRQVTARNVILLKVRITPISGDTAGRLRATLTGNGSGWLICDGVAESITWTRSSSTSQFVFTDSDGSVVQLSPGVTYIGLLPMSSGNVNFK